MDNRHHDFRVTLLGTGGPEMSIDRAGSATLVEAGGQHLLIDAGRNVLQRLYEVQAPINRVTRVFLTHLHSDHIEGLPHFWITPWFLLGRTEPLKIWGPVGTREMVAGMRAFLGHDLVHRANERTPASAMEVEVIEFEGDSIIYAENGVSIRSVPVDHKEGNPAFAFIVDYGGRRLAISGDCTYSQELADASFPADVVIHNVFGPTPELLARNKFKRYVSEMLASPEQAAEVFRRSQTKLGVFTHVIRLDSTLEHLVERAGRVFDGKVVVGEDRMIIDIQDPPLVHAPEDIDDLPELTGRSETSVK